MPLFPSVAVPLSALVLALAPTPVPAPLPPEQPWSGPSERLIARPGDAWITPAEAAAFRTTPDLAATHAFIDRLVAAAPAILTVERFGTSPEGRALVAVRASTGRQPDGTPRPVVLAQAGIHGGEIDGKDAGLMLLRDIAVGRAGTGTDRTAVRDQARALLDRVDLLFVPVFNVDGHARSGPANRPNQRGPMEQGWRTTAQNLNLNRDYLKADAPEMRAMLALIQRVDPILYLDLHVTDGSDHGYDVTYAFAGWDGRYATARRIGSWLDKIYRPAVDAELVRQGHSPFLYVAAIDDAAPDKGIFHGADTPRFSTGWGDMARVPTVLVELHSLKGYRRRVLGMHAMIAASLRVAGAQRDSLRAAIVADRSSRPKSLVVRWDPIGDPIATVPFKGVAYEKAMSSAAGAPIIRYTGRAVDHAMPVFGQAPGKSVTLPTAWWIPPTLPELVERIRLHGLEHSVIDTPTRVAVEQARLAAVTTGAPSEGHVPFRYAARPEPGERVYPKGSIRVPADQPRALLAASLIEAESPDSLLAWGYFPQLFQRTEYIADYALAPMADAMLAGDADLRAAFREKLAADPAFATDPDARLAWFYERSAAYDRAYLLYPVGREVAR